MLNKQKFNEGMMILCEQFQRDASEFLLKGYYMVLRNLTDDQFESAVMHILSTKTFNKMPLAAEILEAINGRPEDAALVALAKVEKAMQQYGGSYSVVFDDPVIHRVINAIPGSWVGMCEMDRDELKFVLKDFLKMYVAFIARNEMDTPPKLYGRHDANNELMGYIASGRAKEYIGYVGDQQKAIALYAEAKAKQISDNGNLKQLTAKIGG